MFEDAFAEEEEAELLCKGGLKVGVLTVPIKGFCNDASEIGAEHAEKIIGRHFSDVLSKDNIGN